MFRRLLAFVATFSLCLSTLSVAYASDYSSGAQVHWYPFNIGGSSKEYCMVSPCSNQFMAALCAIGQLDKYPQLTNPQLTLLSNDDTGGAFYDLAERFGSVAQYGYPSWIGGYDLWSISAWAEFHTRARFFGEDQVWYASGLNETMITNATTDFFKVLNGEVTGGSGDYVEFNVVHVGDSVPDYFKGISKIKIAKDKFNFTELGVTIATLKIYNLVEYPSYGLVNAATFDLGVGSTLEPRSAGDGYTMVTPAGANYGYFSASGLSARSVVTDGVLEIVLPYKLTLSVRSNGPRTDNIYSANNNIIAVYGGVGGGGGGGGDNHWPEPEPPQPQPEPDPPEVPDPPDLPGPPENPTIDPPTVEPEPTGTTPTDYTPWLRAILSALNQLITDLANHCLHIRSYMRTCTNYIASCFSHLEGYMRDCFEWLADQFEFDSGNAEYDDARLLRVLLEINKVLGDIYVRLGDLDSAVSDLSAYLGDIYARLGDLDSAVSDLSAQLADIYIRLGQILGKIGSGGGGRPAPTTEPEVDEGFDFWQWLLELISSKLDAIIEDFVGDIGGFLSELVTKFPFSIPWDIAAYLTLLDAQRVTPVISFVIPAIGGWWGEVPITVDLQPYDNAMAAVRSMMLILWGFCLIMRTDWLGGVFDGATKAVTSFFDRLTGHGGGD